MNSTINQYYLTTIGLILGEQQPFKVYTTPFADDVQNKGRSRRVTAEIPAESLLVPTGLLLALLNNPPGVVRVKLAAGCSTGYSAGSTGYSAGSTGYSLSSTDSLQIFGNPPSVLCSAAYSATGSKSHGLAMSPRSYSPSISQV